MKDIIVSIVVVIFITIATVCASYYFVTKYNIDKENEEILKNGIIVGK